MQTACVHVCVRVRARAGVAWAEQQAGDCPGSLGFRGCLGGWVGGQLRLGRSLCTGWILNLVGGGSLTLTEREFSNRSEECR